MSLMAKHCGRADRHDHHEWTERHGGWPYLEEITRWCAGVGGEKQ